MTRSVEERATEALAGPVGPDHLLRKLLEDLVEERRRLDRRLERISRISDGYQAQLRDVNRDLSAANERLTTALSEVRTLRGFIPMCTRCKRVRDDEGYWGEVASYLGKHSDAILSQGMCPACVRGVEPETAVPSGRPATSGSEEDGVAESSHLAGLLSNPAFQGHPLLDEYARLSRRFTKLAHRLEKISRISDGFQAQLRELNDALQRASRTDPLTGLANRREMMERLHAEANRSFRNSRPFVLVMIDLDEFKAVNDTYGHDAGDAVLKEVAILFRTNLRSFDLCARWGGEEFLLLLAETSPDMAVVTAEKLRSLAEAVRLPHGGAELRITFSAGVATHPPEGNVEDTIREADQALYQAKRAGRNRVVVASPL